MVFRHIQDIAAEQNNETFQDATEEYTIDLKKELEAGTLKVTTRTASGSSSSKSSNAEPCANTPVSEDLDASAEAEPMDIEL